MFDEKCVHVWERERCIGFWWTQQTVHYSKRTKQWMVNCKQRAQSPLHFCPRRFIRPQLNTLLLIYPAVNDKECYSGKMNKNMVFFYFFFFAVSVLDIYLFWIQHTFSCIRLLSHNDCHFPRSLHTRTEHRRWPVCHSTSGWRNLGRCLGPSWDHSGDRDEGTLMRRCCVRCMISTAHTIHLHKWKWACAHPQAGPESPHVATDWRL